MKSIMIVKIKKIYNNTMTISFVINKNKVKTEMIDFSVVWYEKKNERNAI